MYYVFGKAIISFALNACYFLMEFMPLVSSTSHASTKFVKQELLYKKLQELRKNICDEFDVPPHTIASTKTLIDIAKTRYMNYSLIFVVFCVLCHLQT